MTAHLKDNWVLIIWAIGVVPAYFVFRKWLFNDQPWTRGTRRHCMLVALVWYFPALVFAALLPCVFFIELAEAHLSTHSPFRQIGAWFDDPRPLAHVERTPADAKSD